MYYIVHKQAILIRRSIHLSTHDHPVADLEGCSREVFEQVKSLVEKEASRTPRAIVSAIA
jgi:hypothetical protein